MVDITQEDAQWAYASDKPRAVDELRTRFSMALSEMYKSEVPLYGTLIDIVRSSDNKILRSQGHENIQLPIRHEIERHGAIRLGTSKELFTIGRLFAIFGMYPVGYYDLSVVGFPLHATAFRPVTHEALERNPFRVFTTVLRKELLSPSIRAKAEFILQKRSLFTPRLLEIIEQAETNLPLNVQDTNELIEHTLKIFKWHSKALVSIEEYHALKDEHPVVADIVCFPSAHINHLTPRTLDIDLVQLEMLRNGLPAKEKIEGPPRRQCPILLRQTSFRALEERVEFSSVSGAARNGTHTARFGEVEQRGAAVTPKGRALYDKLLKMAEDETIKSARTSSSEGLLSELFASHFPDSWDELRTQKLVYFSYTPVQSRSSAVDTKSSPRPGPDADLSQLIVDGKIKYEAIVYEDFLPISAAGIFTSNLERQSKRFPMQSTARSNKPGIESALHCAIIDEFEVYQRLQRDSIKMCERVLGVQITGLD